MKNKNIQTILLATACSVCMLLSGCSNNVKEINNDDIIISITNKDTGDKKEMTYGVANAYLRIAQAETYSYMQSLAEQFGSSYSDVWSSDPTDTNSDYKNYGEQFKDSALESLKLMLISDIVKDDYDISITDGEEVAIEEASSEFATNNDENLLTELNITEDNITELLRLMTAEQKVEDVIESDVDENIPEEEYEQSTFSYVTISKDSSDDVESVVEGFINKAQTDSFDSAAEEYELTSNNISFTTLNPEYDDYDDTELLTHAVKLEDGEYTSYTNDSGDETIIYMKSLYDKEASSKKKEEIISEQKNELYNDTIEEIKGNFKIETNNDIWEIISVDDNTIYTEAAKDTETE